MSAEKLAVTNATVDYYEKRELEHIQQFQKMKQQRDEVLAVLRAWQNWSEGKDGEPWPKIRTNEAIRKCEAEE